MIRGSEKPWIVVRDSGFGKTGIVALVSQFPVWRPVPQILATKGHEVSVITNMPNHESRITDHESRVFFHCRFIRFISAFSLTGFWAV